MSFWVCSRRRSCVKVVLDVQSVLREDRAVQVVLRVVVGCEREGAARTNMAMAWMT